MVSTQPVKTVGLEELSKIWGNNPGDLIRVILNWARDLFYQKASVASLWSLKTRALTGGLRTCLRKDAKMSTESRSMTFYLFPVDAVGGFGLMFTDSWCFLCLVFTRSLVQGPYCFTDVVFPSAVTCYVKIMSYTTPEWRVAALLYAMTVNNYQGLQRFQWPETVQTHIPYNLHTY